MRLCAACAMLAVVMSSSAHAKATDQTSGLDDTELAVVVEGTLASVRQCSPEFASIFGDLPVCTQAGDLHITALRELLKSVDQAQAEYLVQSLVELSSELHQPQQAYIFQETLLLALVDIEITIEIMGCTVTICVKI